MFENIELYLDRFNSLSQREKQMTVGALLLILWGGWDTLFYQPLQKENMQIESEIDTLNAQLNSQQLIAKQIENIGKDNPNSATRQQLSSLLQSVDNLKQQLNLGDKKFVSSELMASALSDMLKQHGNLKLLKLETLPVSAFGSQDQETAWMYRHTLSITLEGDYFSTLNYLKALESLPWRIHWDSIAYQVKNYPIAETRIQVYTLSFEQDWLGV